MSRPTARPAAGRRRMASLAAACIAAAVLIGPTTAAAAPAVPAGPAAPRAAATKLAVGAQFHGTWAELSDSDRARILDLLKASGATWVRIDISWSMIAPKQRGQYDTAWGVPLVDKVIKMAADRGLNVLGTFWLTPQWASGSADKRVLPKNLQDYADALKWSAARWKTVQAWEVWNEPNAAEFLNPADPAAYTRLLKASYPAVKAGNPAAKVVFAGTMFVDTDWISAAYAAGAKGSFDVMAVHPYQGKADVAPEDVNPSAGRARLTHTPALAELMARNGQSTVPIWFTEFGWSTHANTASTPVWYLGVSEAVQADYLTRSLALIQAKYPQVTNVFWYTSRDLTVDGAYHQNNRGLIRRDFTAKPALTALACYTHGCPSAVAAKGSTGTKTGATARATMAGVVAPQITVPAVRRASVKG
ncbi:MAG: polysaccharide biosynthesis protein PslG [Cryptosporangiaceae bacterium]|nr:polysaccharide biosynthesis protein PslG [Cryptosporangiaceae bacterium]